jgi:hypothetical protein
MKYWFLRVAVKTSHDSGYILALISSNSSPLSLLYGIYSPRKVDNKLLYQAWFVAFIGLHRLL